MDEPLSYQTDRNGPLKPEVIQFLKDLRSSSRLTYRALAAELGVSAAFAHHIINKHARISTDMMMPRIAEGIDRLLAFDARARSRNATLALQENMREHIYHLRENMVVKMNLPRDLTGRESEKLSLFLRSIAD